MIEVETINGLIDLRGKSESIDAQSFNGNIAVQLSDEKCRSIYAKRQQAVWTFRFRVLVQ